MGPILQRYQDSNTLNKKLAVSFIGEIGKDLDGLTRELFALFWKKFLTNYIYGTNQKNIKVEPVQTLSKDDRKSVGKILFHGFLLCSYIPITLNNVLLYFLFIGNEPSDALFNSYFKLNTVQEDEKIALENGIDTEVTKLKIASLFNQFDSNVIPSTSNFGSVVSKVSRQAAWSKPHYYVVSFEKGMHRSHFEKFFLALMR